MLSDKQVEIYQQINGSKDPKDEKTKNDIVNLKVKKQYIVHIRTLQFYLKHGLKLKKMHRAIKIEPKEALRPHIWFNSGKRKNATRDIFKLLDNALTFMVMIENKRHVRAQQNTVKRKNQ